MTPPLLFVMTCKPTNIFDNRDKTHAISFHAFYIQSMYSPVMNSKICFGPHIQGFFCSFLFDKKKSQGRKKK